MVEQNRQVSTAALLHTKRQHIYDAQGKQGMRDDNSERGRRKAGLKSAPTESKA